MVMVQIVGNYDEAVNENNMSKENIINLSKQTLPQLQELLGRQQALIQNRKLLQHLQDKGESVLRLHDKIQREIQYRKDLENVDASMSAITLNTNKAEFFNDKHTKYLCSKEKPIVDERYRPHRTLVTKETKISTIKSLKNFSEITSACEPKLRHDGVKCISLPDSLAIENEQALRVLEEKAKKALSSLNDMVAGNDDDDSDEEEIPETEIVPEES